MHGATARRRPVAPSIIPSCYRFISLIANFFPLLDRGWHLFDVSRRSCVGWGWDGARGGDGARTWVGRGTTSAPGPLVFSNDGQLCCLFNIFSSQLFNHMIKGYRVCLSCPCISGPQCHGWFKCRCNIVVVTGHH